MLLGEGGVKYPAAPANHEPVQVYSLNASFNIDCIADIHRVLKQVSMHLVSFVAFDVFVVISIINAPCGARQRPVRRQHVTLINIDKQSLEPSLLREQMFAAFLAQALGLIQR